MWRREEPLDIKAIWIRTGFTGVEIRTHGEHTGRSFTGLLILDHPCTTGPAIPTIDSQWQDTIRMDLAHPTTDDGVEWQRLLDLSRQILEKLSQHQYVVIYCSSRNQRHYARRRLKDLPSFMACMILIRVGYEIDQAMLHVKNTTKASWLETASFIGNCHFAATRRAPGDGV